MAGKRKYIFAQITFYLQDILYDINEQDTSFLDCKHKHMMKSGAPPDKFVVLYRTSRINSKGYQTLHLQFQNIRITFTFV